MKRLWFGLLIIALLLTPTLALAQDGPKAEPITVEVEGLYPEGIAYDMETGHYFLGAPTMGAVYRVDAMGHADVFVDDEALIMVLGIYADVEGRRLLVTNSDLGLSVRSSEATANVTAGVGVYDLDTGDKLAYYDLGALLPQAGHVANDVTIDDAGNIYVTDSFSPIIYRVDAMGEASIWLQDERLGGEGFAANGIVYQDGYLVVANAAAPTLFKVPTDDPTALSAVTVEGRELNGADGLVLHEGIIYAVLNPVAGAVAPMVVELESADDWATASVVDEVMLEAVGTTAVWTEDGVAVLLGKLDQWLNPERTELDTTFTILPIGLGMMMD